MLRLVPDEQKFKLECLFLSPFSLLFVSYFQEFATVQAMVGMSGTFWIFGLFCLISVLFVLKLVPETKGKSLEDIELYFLGRAMRGI